MVETFIFKKNRLDVYKALGSAETPFGTKDYYNGEHNHKTN